MKPNNYFCYYSLLVQHTVICEMLNTACFESYHGLHAVQGDLVFFFNLSGGRINKKASISLA